VFDPFRDFETAGYLRNKFAEKDPQIVQELEHQMFRASLDEAIAHLSKRRGALSYADFLAVHRILFEGFYPWAGQDRAITAPDLSITKAGTVFSHPLDARLAVEEGLRIGSDK
jgi:cell filamentation protein